MYTIVVFDLCDHSRGLLARDLEELGARIWATGELRAVADLLRAHGPDVVVSDDNLHRPWVRISKVISQLRLTTKMIITTSYASISSAVRATKLGAIGYFEKPVSARRVLECLAGDGAPNGDDVPAGLPRSLHRVRWEHINARLDALGSVRAAASELGLDPHSLRRMLNTYPPNT